MQLHGATLLVTGVPQGPRPETKIPPTSVWCHRARESGKMQLHGATLLVTGVPQGPRPET
jgi:hypothetical protein